MAGRPRKPTALRVLEGNAGKRPLPKNEPKPPVGATCPGWLTVSQTKFWKEWAPPFIEQGVLTELDTLAFANWMIVQDQIRLLTAAGEPVSEGRLKLAQSYAVQFGATPAGRARVSVEPKKPESKLSRLMKRGQ